MSLTLKRLTCTKMRQVWRFVCPYCGSDETWAQPDGQGDTRVECLMCDTVSYKTRD